jgi:Ohr subfamily peroxiredoxin
MKTLYTAHAITEGGRNGHSQTTDGKLKFELAMPGGPTKKTGTVTNPEELFACGYSACFGSALEYVAGQKKIAISGYAVQADVSLNSGDDGFSLGITLNVSIPNMDQTAAQSLAEAAHQVCPYSKATRGNVDVKIHVAPAALAKAG